MVAAGGGGGNKKLAESLLSSANQVKIIFPKGVTWNLTIQIEASFSLSS